jgi:uncharacterized OB-fold protein
MSELQVQRCRRCGTVAFPDRLWCPGCGAGELSHEPAGPGSVEQETTLRRLPAPEHEPVRIGTVRLRAGPLIIARLAQAVQAGTEVRLDRTPAGWIWARATPD